MMIGSPVDLSFLDPFWTTVVVNGIGVHVSFYAIATIERMKPQLEGGILGLPSLFQSVMFLTTCVFVYTLLFTVSGLMPVEPVSIYRLLVAGGTISFAYVASTFAPIILAAPKR